MSPANRRSLIVEALAAASAFLKDSAFDPSAATTVGSAAMLDAKSSALAFAEIGLRCSRDRRSRLMDIDFTAPGSILNIIKCGGAAWLRVR